MLVRDTDQILDLWLLIVLVLFRLLVGQSWQLNIDPLSLPLDVATSNELVLELVDILDIKIKEAMALSIPCV